MPHRLHAKKHLAQVRAVIDEHRAAAVTVAERIAELAEPPLEEFTSAQTIATFLAERGFRVERPWKKLPTAFRATAGKGKPKLALMAEYDALPDCGPRKGQWGHGCGHNLLGAAAALAGVAAAETLGGHGQVIVFGTPAEESLAGKAMMAEFGAFDALDAVLAWHPSERTRVSPLGGAAMDSVSFVFAGQTAHAAGAPHQGRSALDAVMLTDVAVNFLREHVPDHARMHCVVPEGGSAPNVVPDKAEIWYYIRGTDREQVDELTRRVTRCARGAAMATETRCRRVFHHSITERIPNEPVADMLQTVLDACGPVHFTAADKKAAAGILPDNAYAEEVSPPRERGRASSDEDNVSWFAPLGRLDVACVPLGTIAHHRQYARLVRTPGAHKGMLKAAEALAMGIIELGTNAELRRRATAAFRRAMKGRTYDLPKPAAKPRSTVKG